MKCRKGVRPTHWKMVANPLWERLSDTSDGLNGGDEAEAEQ
jgi:hypothetical protein